MNPSLAVILTLACTALGCWLPSLWLAEPVTKKVRSILPLPIASPESAWRSVQARVRSAGSAMQQFQAVVAGMRGRGAAMAFRVEEMTNLNCEEAEELAHRLAGEELGSHVTDGAAFLKSLGECDYNVREAALEAWADAQPEAALKALIAWASDSHGVEEDLIERIAARDPDKALAILRDALKDKPLNDTQTEVWNAVLAACAKTQPDLGLVAIQSAPPAARSSGMHSLLSAMAEKDPLFALQWCRTLPPDLKKLTDESAIMYTWSESDPEAAFKECIEMNILPQASISLGLAATWAKKDPEAVFAWAMEKVADRAQYIGPAARVVASQDPQRALAMLEYVTDNGVELQSPADPFAPRNERRDALCQIGQAWAGKDAAAALAWARSLPDHERSYILNGMRPQLTGLSPEERRGLAQEIGVETSAGFQFLWEADRGEAAAALAAMPVDKRLSNFEAVANGQALTANSPAVAASLLGSLIDDLPEKPDAKAQSSDFWKLSNYVAEVTTTWAGRNPVAAAAWVAHLPPGEAQATAAANVVLTWGRHDFPAARQWVEQLPPGPARDRADEQLTRLLSAAGE